MNKKNNGMKNGLYYVLVVLAMVMVVYFIFEITTNNRQTSITQPSNNNWKTEKSKT